MAVAEAEEEAPDALHAGTEAGPFMQAWIGRSAAFIEP